MQTFLKQPPLQTKPKRNTARTPCTASMIELLFLGEENGDETNDPIDFWNGPDAVEYFGRDLLSLIHISEPTRPY